MVCGAGREIMSWNNHYGSFSEPTRVGSAWFYSSPGEDAGIWKFEPGAEPAKIISGSYTNPVATPDGKWLAAMKVVSEGKENTSAADSVARKTEVNV